MSGVNAFARVHLLRYLALCVELVMLLILCSNFRRICSVCMRCHQYYAYLLLIAEQIVVVVMYHHQYFVLIMCHKLIINTK